MSDNEKRMIGNYEVLQAIHIGDNEVLFCEDSAAECRYMCCYCTRNEILEQTFDGKGSDDYLEIMQLFCERVQGQIVQAREQHIPDMGVISADMCYPNDRGESIDGKVVVMRADSLRPEYRSAERQLYLVRGGNGARGNARGNAVFCYNLYTGKHTRFERYDVQGVIKPEHMPKWARERLVGLQRGMKRKLDKGDR